MSRPRKPITPDVARLRTRVATFRQSHPKHTRLPAALWQDVVGLALQHGVSAVSRATGLGYATLKQRCEASTAIAAGACSAAPFVELRAAQVFGAAKALVTSGGAVVELTDGSGAQLTIRLGVDPSVVEVAALVAAFWSRR